METVSEKKMSESCKECEFRKMENDTSENDTMENDTMENDTSDTLFCWINILAYVALILSISVSAFFNKPVGLPVSVMSVFLLLLSNLRKK
jgi:hypothetical protein